MPKISFQDFLTEVKNQIKESEDFINPIEKKFVHIPPDPKEAREQYFVTQELEIEVSLTSDAEAKGGFNLYVVEAGTKVKAQEVHRIRIKLIKQGHRFRQA